MYKEAIWDMSKWMSVNPVPANILLISDDDSFSGLLHDFSVRKYNIFFFLDLHNLTHHSPPLPM